MDSTTKKINKDFFILASQYYRPHFGGIENSLFFLSKAAIELNDEVKIFISNKGIGKKDRLPLLEKENGIDIVRYKYPFLPHLLLFLHPIILIFNTYIGFKKLKKNSSKNEIVIGRTHFVILAALLAGYDRVVYVVPSMVKGLSDRKNDSLAIRKKIIEFILHKTIVSQHYFFQKLAIKKSHKNIVFSQNMKNQISQQLGINDTLVVPPGVDIKRFGYEGRKRQEIRLKYKLKDKFVFLCLGRITENKGYRDVILAFSKLKATTQKKCKILIVGDGIEVINLKKLTLELELNEFVDFHGATKTPENYFAIADCFMMTSRYEAFGQTILEAMASGLPVIAYKVDYVHIQTASNELIKENKNGFFSDFNPVSLALIMNKACYLTDPERKVISIANILKVKNEYQWTNFLIKIKNVF